MRLINFAASLLLVCTVTLFPMLPTSAASQGKNPQQGSTPAQPVTKTKVEVQENGGDLASPWVKSLTITSAGTLAFRYSTNEPAAASAIWQVSDKPFSSGPQITAAQAPNVIASGALGTVPAPGHVSGFEIHFGLFAPKVPPANAVSYWVFVVTKNSRGNPVGLASPPVKIVYHKSSQPSTDFSGPSAGKAAPATCQQIAGKINGLKSEVSHLQSLLKKASTGEKADLAGQIKDLNAQIAAKEKELEKCKCPGPDDTYYKLPFDDEPAWRLCQGNWDDPIHGHNHGDPNGSQAYAFDFSYTSNQNCNASTEGHNIRAMRAGVVIALAGDRSCNVWGVKEGEPCFGAPGEGNYVMIRHADNTAAAYAHLKKGSLLVKKNQQVARGQIIALSGNTGNSSDPHVHVDVRKYWNSPDDKGPTLPIKFQDKSHRCWRPRVGDTLASNNN